MLSRVELDTKELGDYEAIVGEETVARLYELAAPLRGAHVVHVNSTSSGGGVAVILKTLVPLMRDAGIDAEWQLIDGTTEFYQVTKAFHNALQGMDVEITDDMKEIWRSYNKQNADSFEGTYDYVVVHDPQPAGLRHFVGNTEAIDHWIWRCHIDISSPAMSCWDFLAPYLAAYGTAIFTMEQYAGPGVDFDRVAIIPPSVDPLQPKNRPLPAARAEEIVADFGPDLRRPLITQVSRFDPWKDPIGVIDAYRLIKEEITDVQLALVGVMAEDDPEGWTYLDRTIRHAGEDFDIHILHNYHGVGGLEVGAFQSVSKVILQKSVREGFGLTVSEGLWHERPVVAGAVGGIPLQVVNGEMGFLVDSVEMCAEKTRYLLEHPAEADQMGKAGRERVRERFLVTRHLADYLHLFRELAGYVESDA